MTVQRGTRPTIPNGTASKLNDLMKMCWHPEESKRPTFAEMLKSKVHSFPV